MGSVPPDPTWVPDGLPDVFARKAREHAEVRARMEANADAEELRIATGGTATPWAKRRQANR